MLSSGCGGMAVLEMWGVLSLEEFPRGLFCPTPLRRRSEIVSVEEAMSDAEASET
jgi:hypothetical protein